MSGSPPRHELSPDRLQRRLAAIFSADVQGYSRLMGDDEEQTVQTLTAYREVLTALVTQHQGRIVDMPGDNVLAEFASVIDAVQGAVRLQQVLKERNSDLPPHRRMEFRIGVHLDDVIVEGERIYGDGVNIAARLESLAPAGGICLSGAVYDQVERKLPLAYRFLGEQPLKNIAKPVRVYQVLTEAEPASSVVATPISHVTVPLPPPHASLARVRHFVGRAAELEYLEQCLAAALSGQRQIVFVTGDPGIGKTTLLDTFLERLRDRIDLRVAYGQCVEQYGQSEAYLPLLEAAGRLCRAPDREQLIESLKQYAPTWLVQMPALIDQRELELLQQRVQGANRERMLREMAEAAELLAARQGVVLVLEDLHWSDTATLEWVAYIARRRETAKLLIIGTYRPADMLLSDHPLKGVVQELLVRGQCEELRLTPLNERAVHAYLASRLTGTTAPPEWTMALYRRTGGNPLFLVNMLDYLIQQGVVVEEDDRWRIQDGGQGLEGEVPDTLRRLIEKQFERLTEEDQQLLEVASVEGREFMSAAVAAGLQMTVEAVEERCERLARKSQFICSEGVKNWPDGTIGGRYSFLHALYQNVLYERIAEVRRVRLHRALGIRKEQAYGKQAREIAGELAAHFAVGRDVQRAVTYSRQAAETAVRRHAHQEAVAHVTKGLELLQALPDAAERVQSELGLQVIFATSLMSLKGYAATEVEQAYARAHELCQQVETTPHLFPVLRGLVSFYQVRARLQTARELGEQLLHLCQRFDDPLLQAQAHYGHGVTLFDLAEFDSSTAHLTHTLALYTPQEHSAHVFLYGGYDPGVACHQWLARILWVRGYPTQAKQRSDEALRLARELGHPLSLAWAWNIAAVIHQYRGEESAAQACVQEALSTSQEHELAFMTALAMILQGWSLIGQGQRIAGIEKIREGLTAYQSTGAALSLPGYLSLLAGAHARNGQLVEAQRLVAEAVAITDKTGERWFEAELHRIKGELISYQQSKVGSQQAKIPNPQYSASNPHAEAEACFLKALEIARQQQAKSWELRATMSLARLWQRRGKISDAKKLLEEIYDWFTEGFDTKDLQEAAVLLTELGGSAQKTDSRKQTAEDREQGPGNRDRGRQPTGLRLKASGPPPPSLSSLQPVASSPSQDPELETQSSVLSTQHAAVFRREGEYWTVTFAGETCRLRDNRGMRYLAQLLQHPNEELHSLRIAADDSAQSIAQLGPSSRGIVNELVDAEEKPLTGFSDAGEMLDPQARAAYKQRLADLQSELEEAREFNDMARIETLEEEIEFLTRELSHAVGFGGRIRKAGSAAERARVNVTKAIKAALRQIGKVHPALGLHLHRTIHTGSYCSYAPDPSAPTSWQT